MSIVARDIGYRVGKHWLVQHVDLTVSPGEMLVILGPNGAGKSTLFNLLTGEWPTSCGQVEFFGVPYADWLSGDLALRRSVLPQHSSLTFPFTVEEVVAMGRTPHRSGMAIDRKIIADLIQQCELEAFRTRLYPWLSGGEKQRVQLARVLAQIWREEKLESVPAAQSRYLFLDEPTSALDIAHQHGMLQLAKRLTAQGEGVIVILHDLNMASAYADRVIILDHGRVAGSGTVEAVFQKELICDIFGVSVEIIEHPERGIPWVIW